MSFVEEVQRRIFAKTSLFGTWLPTDRIQVGEYGLIRRGRFNREGNLRQRGIEVSESRTKLTPSALGFSDRAKINTVTKVSAKAAKVASGTVEIALSGEGAFVYQLQDLTACRIADKEAFFTSLFSAILSDKLKWQDDFVVVDELREAGAATLIVLENEAGKLTVKGDIPLGAESAAPLARVGANVTVDIERGSIFQAMGQSSSTPLYGAKRLSFAPPGPAGPARSISEVFAWLREKCGFAILRADEVRMVDYVALPNEERATFEVQRTQLRFAIAAEQLSLDTFLQFSAMDDVSTFAPPVEAEEQVQYIRQVARGG